MGPKLLSYVNILTHYYQMGMLWDTPSMVDDQVFIII